MLLTEKNADAINLTLMAKFNWEELLPHCLKRFSAIKLKTGPRNVIGLKYKD